MKLTELQLATLGYIAMKCEITLYGKSKGTPQMQRLVVLGLLDVVDSSYAGYTQSSWSLTQAGRDLIKKEEKAIQIALGRQGWI